MRFLAIKQPIKYITEFHYNEFFWGNIFYNVLNIIFCKYDIDILEVNSYNASVVLHTGCSLVAKASGLGPEDRGFESLHPDFARDSSSTG